ncbi:MAG TPA: competence/damage-inducible protein A [Patescibacteria group bacterium]|nr:competence/damage-inducible protein A [Patescibacteria group bacterium]
MIVEIVSTGTELLLGQIVNTSAPYLARRLNELGFSVLFQSTVGDNRERMSQVIAHALERSDIVITSGGLGPTLGDITKEVAATLLNRTMYLDKHSEDRIRQMFAARHICMTDNNLRQAMIPEGGIVLDNQCGTAPGVVLETEDGKIIIHLPGPPFELEAMFEDAVEPYLRQRYGLQGVIVSRVLRTFGLGESLLEERIHDHLLQQGNPTIALLARSGEIHVRITAQGKDAAAANRLIATKEAQLRERLDEYIFSTDDESLETLVGRLLQEKKLTLALAESCTGGLVTSRVTDVSGSSAYLMGAVVCYDNRIKADVVGVNPRTLETEGAVSEPVACQMAEGIRSRLKTQMGIGITGIAGPDGGSPEKPVGLVFIAVAGPAGVQCHRHYFSGGRDSIKKRTAQTALHHLRRYLLALPAGE